MRQFDYAPLYRSTVGFDRLVQLLDAATGLDTDSGYPPYNIERLNDQSYRITMAVAGFGEGDLKIDVKENALSVRGDKKAEASEKRQFLHRGIGERAFERRFQLADYVEVTGANLKDGILSIELTRNLPERMKPRTVHIGTAVPAGAKQIEAAVN
ncbi:MAG: Hsp20 family protein [Hyphomicrobiaceae bacterium]